MPFTTTDIISSVKSRVFMPDNQATITDTDIINYTNLEMRGKVFPQLLQKHEEYYITTTNIPLVTGVSKYRIPVRSNAQTLRDIKYVDASGNIYDIPLTTLDREDEWDYSATSRPAAYYIIRNDIQLLPLDVSMNTGYLKVRYAFTPNKLVDVSRTCQVTSSTSSTITVDAVPSNITVGGDIDVVTYKPGNEVIAFSIPVTDITGTTITTTVDLSDYGISADDYVCTAEETPVMQLPASAEPYLIECIAHRIFRATGRLDKANDAAINLQYMEREFSGAISNRATEPVKLIRRNSFLRRRPNLRGWNVGYTVKD